MRTRDEALSAIELCTPQRLRKCPILARRFPHLLACALAEGGEDCAAMQVTCPGVALLHGVDAPHSLAEQTLVLAGGPSPSDAGRGAGSRPSSAEGRLRGRPVPRVAEV